MIKDREKRLQSQRDWYKENKEHHKKNAARNRKVNKERNRRFVLEYRQNNPCIKCGEDDTICLDFHHRLKKEKDDSICNLIRRICSLKRIQNEIDKCDVLCKNCHAKEHRKDRGL